MIDIKKGIFMITGMSNIAKSHWVTAIEDELLAKNTAYGKLINPKCLPAECSTVRHILKTLINVNSDYDDL